MPCCSAMRCRNRTEEGFKLFRFPVGDRRTEWVKNMRRGGNWLPNNNSRLCEKHFEESQFETEQTSGLKLKRNAVPTLFSPAATSLSLADTSAKETLYEIKTEMSSIVNPLHCRKQHIRIRDSTALMPATYVEPPSIKTEIVDLEYVEPPSPTKRISKRPRSITKKFNMMETSWPKKGVNNVTTDENDSSSRNKITKRKGASEEIVNTDQPIKRAKYAGPLTSYLHRPFERTPVTPEVRKIIIKNQPILRLTRLNDILMPPKNRIVKRPPAPPSPATPVNCKKPGPSGREPVFIAVEDDNIDQNSMPHPVDPNDTKVSSTILVCRLCGVPGTNRFSLIGMRSESLNLLVHLKNYLNIEIMEDENLPLHICPLCSQTIISFFKFHRRVKTATNRLRAIINERQSSNGKNWENVPWNEDNILARSTASNDYLTRKHILKSNRKEDKTKNGSTKFVTTNIEQLFGRKSKRNGINPKLIVKEFASSDNESQTENDQSPTPETAKTSTNDDTEVQLVETINLEDDDPKNTTISKTSTPNKMKNGPRLILTAKPPFSPKSPPNNTTLLNTHLANVSRGSKTFLIPVQNLSGFNNKSPMKIALSPGGPPIFLQNKIVSNPGTSQTKSDELTPAKKDNVPLVMVKSVTLSPKQSTIVSKALLSPSPLSKVKQHSAPLKSTNENSQASVSTPKTNSPPPLSKLKSVQSSKSATPILQQTLATPKTPSSSSISSKSTNSPTAVPTSIETDSTPSSSLKNTSTCLPLNPAEEKELNAIFRAPSKDDKYTYVVRMERNVGEQPYFILTANPIKLKSPELTKHNVGIICKSVYKAEVEKKKLQENEGNFSNIGLHCWAQHIVWFWQLKLPGDVRLYVKQSADKILQFGQRKRIDYAKKCLQVSKQICTEAINKVINQSLPQKSSKVATTAQPIAKLPKLIPRDSSLPKLIAKRITTNILPKLIPKDPVLPTNVVATNQQLLLIPVKGKSKDGNNSITYMISPNSNVQLSDIIGSTTPVHTHGRSEENNVQSDAVSLANEAKVSGGKLTNVMELKKTEESNKIQLCYTDDNEGEGMFDMECVSDDEDHDVQRTSLDNVPPGSGTNSDVDAQIETIDLNAAPSETIFEID